jgi:hypothetical protein
MEAYRQHAGKVIEADKHFKHVMALTLDPSVDNRRGLVRCITSREGDVQVRGYIDRSTLHSVQGDSLENFVVGEQVLIKNDREILQELGGEGLDYLGLEDPDIWRDPQTGLVHVYFTIPFIRREKTKQSRIHLGHAVGQDLDSLEMTMPTLLADAVEYENARAKEVSIAPLNTRGLRYNLFESHDKLMDENDTYSTVRVAIAEDMGKPWQFGETVFHPAERKIPWIAGHASPGPLFSKSFLDVGQGKVLGILNGREANKHKEKKTIYGMFSVGLFVYDYEHGRIEWVSPQPLIQDSDARTITFASHFVETKPGEGILYAHVDDSFVRAYTLFSEGIRQLLP